MQSSKTPLLLEDDEKQEFNFAWTHEDDMDGRSAADGDEVNLRGGSRRGPRRPWWLILGIVLAVLALALGLGIGLGVRRGDGDDDDDGDDPDGGGGQSPRAAPPAELWKPPVNATWQIVLSRTLKIEGAPSPDVDIYDIDLQLHVNNTVIADLHKLGKKVICYFSAGSFEPYRVDSSRFLPEDKGLPLESWPDEMWINITSPNVRSIMADRIKMASGAGCDAIDPDNVDGFQNKNGLNLTLAHSVDYIKFLAGEAHKVNMAIGLKNAGDLIQSVLSVVDFSVNEECAAAGECGTFATFTRNNKPVFHIEYPTIDPNSTKVEAAPMNQSCRSPNGFQFSTVLKKWDLDGWVQYCNGATANTTIA